MPVPAISSYAYPYLRSPRQDLIAHYEMGRMGNRHPSIAPYETLPTADGAIAVAVGNDRQFSRFARALDRPELEALFRDTAAAQELAQADKARAEAALYETLATLRTDVPLTETLDQLACKLAPTPELEALCVELNAGDVWQRVQKSV